MKKDGHTSKIYSRIKVLSTTTKIILAIILVIGIGAIGLKTIMSTETKATKLGFEDIGELSTQVAYCTEVICVDKSRDIFGVSIPFTQTKYIYSYDCIVKAGYQFEEIDWSVDEANQIITIKLPEVQITGNEVVQDSLKVYHEQESIFTPVSLSTNNEALIEMRQQAEDTAIENGLFDNAEENAKNLINIFVGAVYPLDKYQIKYVD